MRLCDKCHLIYDDKATICALCKSKIEFGSNMKYHAVLDILKVCNSCNSLHTNKATKCNKCDNSDLSNYFIDGSSNRP